MSLVVPQQPGWVKFQAAAQLAAFGAPISRGRTAPGAGGFILKRGRGRNEVQERSRTNSHGVVALKLGLDAGFGEQIQNLDKVEKDTETRR